MSTNGLFQFIKNVVTKMTGDPGPIISHQKINVKIKKIKHANYTQVLAFPKNSALLFQVSFVTLKKIQKDKTKYEPCIYTMQILADSKHYNIDIVNIVNVIKLLEESQLQLFYE